MAGNEIVKSSTQFYFVPPRLSYSLYITIAKINDEKPDLLFAPHVETSSGIILPHEYMKAIVDDSVITDIFEELGFEDKCPTDTYGESSPQNILRAIILERAGEPDTDVNMDSIKVFPNIIIDDHTAML